MAASDKTKPIPAYAPAESEELRLMGGAELKALAAGRGKRAEAADREILRRSANKARKAALRSRS